MPKTVVWVPFRGDGGGWRAKNMDLVLQQVETLGFDVWVHDSGDHPFSIARTWNELGARGGWDRAVCWGADFLLADPAASVERAINSGHHYMFAFDECSTLNAPDTRRLVEKSGLTGAQFLPRTRLPFGGVRVITRAMFEDIGGYDPRFIGWGHEDRAFVHAMTLLWGPPARVSGHMLNLWHPKKQDRPKDPYFARAKPNKKLWAEYQAITTPDEMRLFLEAR